LQRVEKNISSLAVCYAFLASLAALLLIYARLVLQANPPDLGNLLGGVMHGSASAKGAELLDGARSALFALRERMHTTWLFFAVFGAVWLGCLIWMQIERYRRGIKFSRREGWWIVGFTAVVFASAVLYGLGTNGILAEQFPGIIPVSDVCALAFILAVPLVAWSWLGRLEEDQEDAEYELEGPAASRQGFLGLDDETTNARLVESLSRLEVKPVDLLPSMQALHSEQPSEHARAAATRLIETAEAPAAALAPVPVPAVIEPAASPVPVAAGKPSGADIDVFRQNLAAMNDNWQRIEALRGQIDEWFEVRRQEAIARLETHPGMRTAALEGSLFENFPGEKLAAVDAAWADIRKAAGEINRWFEEAPGNEKGN